MRMIPDTFEHGGFGYAVFLREHRYTVYRKWPLDNPGRDSFEVFQRRILPAATFTRKGKAIETPVREAFPRDEDFGKWAWTFIKWDDVSRRFAEAITPHKSIVEVPQ